MRPSGDGHECVSAAILGDKVRKHLKDRGGNILNIGSISGIAPLSKAAMIHLTERQAVEYAEQVAKMAAFVASEGISCTTCAEFPVGGGLQQHEFGAILSADALAHGGAVAMRPGDTDS